MSEIIGRVALRKPRDIRLLTLLAGTDDTPIHCKLSLANLDDHPQYEALSYEWKAIPGEETILCCGTELPVTRNLFLALNSLRQPQHPRCLWIDAICINQGDNREKGQQVALMTKIYAFAKRVLAWLGPSRRTTAEVFQKLNLLAKLHAQFARAGMTDDNAYIFLFYSEQELDEVLFHDPFEGKCFSPPRSNVMNDPIEDVLALPGTLHSSAAFEFNRRDLWKDVGHVFSNSYFRRAWILQEISVANTVLVQQGNFKISWGLFQAAFSARCLLLFLKANNFGGFHALGVLRSAREQYWNHRAPIDLAKALVILGASKATDARDHVYAALGLVQHGHETRRIVPDYQMAVEKVFLEAASHIIKDRQDLYLWRIGTVGRSSKLKDLPSWVPNWSIGADETSFLYYALGGLESCIKGRCEIINNSLWVDGHILDIIHSVFDMTQEDVLFDLIYKVDIILKNVGSGLLCRYRTELGNDTEERKGSSENQKYQRWLSLLAEVFAILCKLRKVPEQFLNALSDLCRIHNLKNPEVLYIETFWDILTKREELIDMRQEPSHVPGKHLFLAGWYWVSVLIRTSAGIHTDTIPYPYIYWLKAAAALQLFEYESWQELSDEHIARIDRDNDFFLTQSGYFGRSPRGQAKAGNEVVILGGTTSLYILEKVQSHHLVICHTYVEGVSELEELPQGSPISRIEIR